MVQPTVSSIFLKDLILKNLSFIKNALSILLCLIPMVSGATLEIPAQTTFISAYPSVRDLNPIQTIKWHDCYLNGQKIRCPF